MNIEIEIYKGQSITYNDDSDKFESEIELNDKIKSTKRSSLKDVRKEIDNFVKLNLEFRPFKFLKKSPYLSDRVFHILECTALRTDGKFVVSGIGDKHKSYYSKKDMELAMQFDSEIVGELERLEKEIKDAQKKYHEGVAALYDKLIPYDLSAYIDVNS